MLSVAIGLLFADHIYHHLRDRVGDDAVDAAVEIRVELSRPRCQNRCLGGGGEAVAAIVHCRVRSENSEDGWV